jgi:ankyrin repeat protein
VTDENDKRPPDASSSGRLEADDLLYDECVGFARKPKIEALATLLDAGALDLAPRPGRNHLLHWLCGAGDHWDRYTVSYEADELDAIEALVRRLLDADVVPDPRGNNGRTPLHDAVAYRAQTDIPALLVDAGAHVNATDDSGQTPLHCVREARDAELLLEAGADVNVVSSRGRTPLHHAALKGDDGVETARLLIDAGIDPSVTDERGRTARGYAMEKDAPTLARLLAGTADAGPSDLTVACRLGRKDDVESMLADGADPNSSDPLGRAAVERAARANRRDIMELLVDRGARLDVYDNHGISILHTAAQYASIDVLEWLLDEGIPADARRGARETALIRAAGDYDRAKCELLLERGADINASGNAYEGQKSVMTPLLAAIWFASHRDRVGPTRSFVEFILEQGADMSATDGLGRRALHYATFLGERREKTSVALARLLLGRGDDPADAGTADNSPLELARQYGSDKLVALMHSAGGSRA